MNELRTLPMCGMCGKGSTRLVQTLKGVFLLCASCDPPTAAGPPIIREPLDAAPPRFNLPALPKRKLPPLPPRRPVVLSARKTVVKCVVDYTYQENESGNEQECVVVECGKCEHSERSWGHGDKSVRRCLVLMGQNCPDGDGNFYAIDEDT